MLPSLTDALIIIAAGLVAGFFNTIAGGGSLISMPILIFLGLQPTVANATNRVALVAQNISAVAGFKSKGISDFSYSLWLGLAALPGGVMGAIVAEKIDGPLFNKILAVIMVGVVIYTIFQRKREEKGEADMRPARKWLGFVAMFFIGFYGGFVQAGVGFIIIAALGNIHGLGLVRINAIKVFVVLIYTIAAVITFAWLGVVNWYYGLILAIGNAAGGWISSRLSVKKGDKFVRAIMLVTVIALAIKLFFFK